MLRVRWRELRRQEVGLDVSRIKQRTGGLVEGGKGARLAGAAAGRHEIDLNGRFGQRESLA